MVNFAIRNAGCGIISLMGVMTSKMGQAMVMDIYTNTMVIEIVITSKKR